MADTASLHELREEAARVRAAADPDPDATYARLRRERSVREWTDADGGWNMRARGPADLGAVIRTQLQRLADGHFRAAHAEGRQEPREAYTFDALLDLARRGEHTGSETGDGDRSTGPDEAAANADRADRLPTQPPRAANPRYLALLRLDLNALQRGTVNTGEMCEITGLGPVPVSRARELLGESILKLVLTKGKDVANVTHLGRGPTAAQRIALLWQTPTCTAEGCSRTRVEIDHRTPWALTRHTRLDDLDPLCDHHHDLKTRLGWQLAPGTGKRPMYPPGHPGLEPKPPP